MPTVPDAFCPYVGLQPFTEEQHDFFFGRTRDIRVIASNLYASPLTVLYGDSGVGKSSVLLAGVVPHLKSRARTAVVVFREWQQPQARELLKAECLKAVTSASDRTFDVPLNLPLDDFLMELAARFRGTTLLILDQFEEYFLYNPASSAEDSLDAELARAINREEVEANFLLALREDGLAKLDRFRARIPHLLGNTLRLRHLDVAAAEEAITEPLRVMRERAPDSSAPAAIEPDLVQAILAQVQRNQVALHRAAGTGESSGESSRAQIETPYLQLVLTRLWTEELSRQSPVLRRATLEELGGAGQIARTYLDGVMQQLDPSGQALCSNFFDRLVTPSGGKIAYTAEDLTRYAGDLTGEVPRVLKALSDSRILRSIAPAGDQPGGVRYEIFHDVLGAAILDWRRRFLADQAAAESRKRAAAELEAQRQELERARQLSEERARAAEERLNATRKVRRLTNVVGVVVVLLVLIGAAAWFNLSRLRTAQRQQSVAEAARQEAEARTRDANQWAEEAKRLAAEADAAAQKAHQETERAQKANQDLVAGLQAQLAEARKLIESYTRQAGPNAALARGWLDGAEKAEAVFNGYQTQVRISEANAAQARATAATNELRLRETETKAAAAREGAAQLIRQKDLLQKWQ